METSASKPELKTVVFTFDKGWTIITNHPFSRWLIYQRTRLRIVYKIEPGGVSKAKANKLLKKYLKNKRK